MLGEMRDKYRSSKLLSFWMCFGMGGIVCSFGVAAIASSVVRGVVLCWSDEGGEGLFGQDVVVVRVGVDGMVFVELRNCVVNLK